MPVLQISDAENPKIAFSFDSSVTKLEEGTEIVLESVKTGKTFTGTVSALAESDSLSDSKRKAEVAIPKESAEIGDRVRVRIAGVGREGVTVPESAIVTRYLVPSVFVVENGKAVSKTVRVTAR